MCISWGSCDLWDREEEGLPQACVLLQILERDVSQYLWRSVDEPLKI